MLVGRLKITLNRFHQLLEIWYTHSRATAPRSFTIAARLSSLTSHTAVMFIAPSGIVGAALPCHAISPVWTVVKPPTMMVLVVMAKKMAGKNGACNYI